MKKITSVTELRETIHVLELKQEKDMLLLREQLKTTYEALKPINLIKSTLKEFTTEPNVRGDLLNMVIGLGAGFLSKKVVAGKSPGVVRQILGSLVQMGVSNVVSKHSDGLSSGIKNFFGSFFGKKEKSE